MRRNCGREKRKEKKTKEKKQRKKVTANRRVLAKALLLFSRDCAHAASPPAARLLPNPPGSCGSSRPDRPAWHSKFFRTRPPDFSSLRSRSDSFAPGVLAIPREKVAGRSRATRPWPRAHFPARRRSHARPRGSAAQCGDAQRRGG